MISKKPIEHISLSGELIKELLEKKYEEYNSPQFIETDPIQIPHSYKLAEDIEISAFLTATIAWGQRKSIINNAQKMMSLMDNNPYDFIRHATENDFQRLNRFVHRTFNGSDLIYFVKSLRNIYSNYGGLKSLFETNYKQNKDLAKALVDFRNIFFETPGPSRTGKHVSDINKGASAKRLNMFLRWMVRNDNRGVDFGLWKNIPSSALYLPLDLHTGNVSRKLGILKRKQNDWQAVNEVTDALRKLDPKDPVKYDFALFGLGIFEKF